MTNSNPDWSDREVLFAVKCIHARLRQDFSGDSDALLADLTRHMTAGGCSADNALDFTRNALEIPEPDMSEEECATIRQRMLEKLDDASKK